MTRRDDWEQRLADFMEANRAREFEWGSHDCILFAVAAVEAMTGEDPAAAYRGRYHTAKGARAALRELGKGTLLRTVNANFKRKPVAYAQRGDLVWRDGCVGICLGATAAFLTEPGLLDRYHAPRLGNLALLPRTLWQKAWAV